MKQILSFLIFGIVALTLFSCDTGTSTMMPWSGTGAESDSVVPYTRHKLNDTKTFYSQNMTNNSFYTLSARLLHIGSYCTVWVQSTSSVTQAQAKNVGSEYDDKIYSKMIDAFGTRKTFKDPDTGANTSARNTMQFADLLGDADGRLCILLLNIQDGANPLAGDAYVAGYFAAYNFFNSEPGYYLSNLSDMIYIDARTINTANGLKEAYSTLAHEMQHLMNFTTTVDLRFDGTNLNQTDTWIDEGLSSAAEYVYGGHLQNRVKHFNEDRLKSIGQGNNFFMWDNYSGDTVLDDYATVYLFFQWLRIQASPNRDIGFYKEISQSAYPDYRAVLNAAKKINSGWDWGTVLGSWMAANYYNTSESETGSNPLYTYKNDGILANVEQMYSLNTIVGNQAATAQWPLAPGEGVFTGRSGSSVPASSGNIRYLGLGGSTPSTSGGGGILLSYNIDTNLTGSDSNCRPFGNISTAPSTDPATKTAAKIMTNQQTPAPAQPYAISAGEMLRRHGFNDETSNLPRRGRERVRGE